jgi:hypothetical protein
LRLRIIWKEVLRTFELCTGDVVTFAPSER